MDEDEQRELMARALMTPRLPGELPPWAADTATSSVPPSQLGPWGAGVGDAVAARRRAIDAEGDDERRQIMERAPIPRPRGPGEPPRWVAETLPVRLAKGLILGAIQAVKTPGDVAAGKFDVKPSTPGVWSEADEARLQMANATALNRAFDLAGLMTLRPAGGPRGAIGMGPTRPPTTRLPMDQASRLGRAKDTGYDIDMPLYHGTDKSFRSFDPRLLGSTTDTPTSRVGFWLARDPETAAEFARLAAETTRARQAAGLPVHPATTSEQIYPLFHRSARPKEIHLKGDEPLREMADMVAQAWVDGNTSVRFRNFRNRPGASGEIVIVQNANQLRSPNAAFDPARKNSSDLLASIAAAMGIPPSVLLAHELMREPPPDQ